MAAVRKVALRSSFLSREDLDMACRVARRLVLVKSSVRDTDFASLDLVPVSRSRGASFTYGVRMCDFAARVQRETLREG